MLHNAVWRAGWGCQISRKKRVTKVNDSMLLALWKGGLVSNFQEKSVT